MSMINDKVTEKIMRWIAEDPSMILIVKERYLTEDMWEYCIDQEPDLFTAMHNPSSEFIDKMVKKNGCLVLIALEKWANKVTKSTIYHAVCNMPSIIGDIPEEYLDWQIKEAAYDRSPKLMQNDKSIRYSYVERRIREDPTIIQYIDATEDQICEAIRMTPAVCVYVKNRTPKIKNLIQDLYPESYPLLFPEDDDLTEGLTRS